MAKNNSSALRNIHRRLSRYPALRDALQACYRHRRSALLLHRTLVAILGTDGQLTLREFKSPALAGAFFHHLAISTVEPDVIGIGG